MPLRVRVPEHERTLHQRFGIIESQSFKVLITLWVDEHLHSVVLEDLIRRASLGFELEFIAESGASAADHAEPQAAFAMVLLEQLADLGRRLRGNINHSTASIANLDGDVQI